MAVSVIVSNLNGARYLPRLLETLKGQRDVTLQLIIVDRHSKDESAQILARHPDVEVISEPPETGLVAGYARAVPHARHERLFFCNEDMWFSPDCLSLVERQFDVQGVGRVGAVMPIQLSYDGSRMVNCGGWFAKSRWYRIGPHPFRESIPYPSGDAGPRELVEAETISGINAGACMVSRAAYDDVGGWDGTFFLDYEDMDLSIRLWQHGWTCRVEPRALVYHAVGASNAQVIHAGTTTVGRKRYVGALSNRLTIALKYFTAWAPLAVPALLADQIARDLARRRFEAAKLDLAAAWLTIRRMPAVLRYRQQNRRWNHERPGQRYFDDSRFVARIRS